MIAPPPIPRPIHRRRYPDPVLPLICIDVDGTLVGASDEPTAAVWEAAEAAVKQCAGCVRIPEARKDQEPLDALLIQQMPTWQSQYLDEVGRD